MLRPSSNWGDGESPNLSPRNRPTASPRRRGPKALLHEDPGTFGPQKNKRKGEEKPLGGEGSYKTFNTRMQYLWWRIYWKHLSIFILCPSYVISFSKNLSIVFDFGLLKNTRKCWCEWLQRYLSTRLGAVGSHQGRTRFAGAACCWQKCCKGYMNNRFSLWNCWNQQCYFTCIHLHIFFVYLRATVCFISVEIGFRFDVENSILFVDQLQEGCRIGVSGSKSTELLYLGTLRYSGRGRRGVSIQWTIDVKENSPQLPEGKSCRPLSSPRFFGLYFTFSRGAKKQKSQTLEKMVGMPAFMTSLHKLYVLSGCFTHHILLHQASRFHAISMSPFTTREGNQNNQHFHDDRWVNNEKYLRKKKRVST